MEAVLISEVNNKMVPLFQTLWNLGRCPYHGGILISRVNTVEPLYSRHCGTLETVLIIVL